MCVCVCVRLLYVVKGGRRQAKGRVRENCACLLVVVPARAVYSRSRVFRLRERRSRFFSLVSLSLSLKCLDSHTLFFIFLMSVRALRSFKLGGGGGECATESNEQRNARAVHFQNTHSKCAGARTSESAYVHCAHTRGDIWIGLVRRSVEISRFSCVCAFGRAHRGNRARARFVHQSKRARSASDFDVCAWQKKRRAKYVMKLKCLCVCALGNSNWSPTRKPTAAYRPQRKR